MGLDKSVKHVTSQERINLKRSVTFYSVSMAAISQLKNDLIDIS